MFTGIVQQVGTISVREDVPGGVRLGVDPGDWRVRPARGDSVAVSGCCLTVSELAGPATRGDGLLWFDVIHQTLGVTTLGRLGVGDRVNLEPPVTPATFLSGHVVQGHVDGVGEVVRVEAGDDRRLRIRPPAALMGSIIDKGSIAVDGVSLTVAALGERWFEVALIPTTLERTTLGALGVGDGVNLETDYLVKIVKGLVAR